MPDAHMLSVAYHEAAHAVAAVIQGCPIIDCTLRSDGEAGCVNMPPFYPDRADPDDLRKYAIVYLAGWEAQILHEPDLNADLFARSIEPDVQNARMLVGISVSDDAERFETLDRWRLEARELVTDNWASIHKVGTTLLTRHTLSSDEIASLIGVTK